MYSRSHRLAKPSAPFQASFAGCRQDLAAARALADAGLPDAALELCVDLILDDLPALQADVSLVQSMVEILLLTGGIGLLPRLLRAMFGASVTFVPAGKLATTDQAFSVSQFGKRVTIALDPAVLQRGLGAERAARWSRRIIEAAGGAD